MDSIKIVIECFLVSMAGGLGIMTLFSDPKTMGHGLAKVVHSTGLASFLIALCISLTHGSFHGPLTALYLLNSLLMLLLLVFHERLPRPLDWALYLVKVGAFLGLALVLFPPFGEKGPMPFLNFLLAALFIGSVMFGMILGHWYLVVPKLSERPLLIVMKVIWLFLAAKVILSVRAQGPWSLESMDSFKIMLIFMRYVWGYVAIFILSLFTWKLVKMRSIQSATGLLYIMVFFLLVGEVISQYLTLNYGQTL